MQAAYTQMLHLRTHKPRNKLFVICHQKYLVLYKSVFILLCVFMKSNNKQSTVGNPICEVLEETLAVQYVI